MVLRHDSEEKAIFLLYVSKELSQLDFYTLNSVISLNLLFKVIFGLFADCWATYTKRIMVTT